MSNNNTNIEERGSFFLLLTVIILLFLISPTKCKAQEKPYKKPLIERKKDKKGNDIILIREKSCGNHKDKYAYYIKLPQNYFGISYKSTKPDTMLCWTNDDTLYVEWANKLRRSKIN